MVEHSNNNINTRSNDGFIDNNILNLRLNNDVLLRDIEIFLSGKKIEKVIEGRETKFHEIKIGNPLMNSQGVQAIINYLRLTISPHTVQGNFTDGDYRDFVKEMDDNLSCTITPNIDRWDINDDDYDHIIDSIMSSVQMFVSRLIDNKERDSYASTLRSVESNTVDSKGGLKIFGMGGS